MPGNFHTIPPSIVASWPPPNYVDPVRRSWLPILACTLLGVSTVLIAGRFYLRARKQAGDFGLDDLFISVGWLVSVGFSTVAVVASECYGLDVHTWDVRYNQYVGAALTGWIAQVLFVVSTSATKTSVLLFYRRMVKDTYSRRWLYAIWAALGCNAAFFIAVLVTFCLICQPLSSYWASYNFTYDKPYKCIDGNVLTVIAGVLSIISDLYAVILPCLMLRHYDLDVPRRQKIGLNIIFALGTIVAGCSCVRTYYLWKINHTYDTSWTGFNLYVWSLLECHLSVIFASAPSLRAFFRRYLGETFTRTFRTASHDQSRHPTIQSSQNASTIRNSHAATDIEAAKTAAVVDQKVLAKPSDETMETNTEAWSGRSRSSFTVTSPDDYEVYNMHQLNKHGYKQSSTSDAHDWGDPKRTHNLENAVWYPDPVV